MFVSKPLIASYLIYNIYTYAHILCLITIYKVQHYLPYNCSDHIFYDPPSASATFLSWLRLKHCSSSQVLPTLSLCIYSELSPLRLIMQMLPS